MNILAKQIEEGMEVAVPNGSAIVTDVEAHRNGELMRVTFADTRVFVIRKDAPVKVLS